MYEEHWHWKNFPNVDSRLWRYMDLPKFINILDTETLWFSRIDKLGDPLEAKFTRYDLEQQEKNPTFNQVGTSTLKTINYWERYMPKLHFANCWHENDFESAAMWKIYSSGNDQAIAIQTTFEKLTKSFLGDAEIYAGQVTYLDSMSQPQPIQDMIDLVTHKRISFSYENEVRAIRQFIPPKFDSNYLDSVIPMIPVGYGVDIDINTLIEKVYVSPNSPNWFKEQVKTIIKKFNFNFEVEDSTMNERLV